MKNAGKASGRRREGRKMWWERNLWPRAFKGPSCLNVFLPLPGRRANKNGPKQIVAQRGPVPGPGPALIRSQNQKATWKCVGEKNESGECQRKATFSFICCVLNFHVPPPARTGNYQGLNYIIFVTHTYIHIYQDVPGCACMCVCVYIVFGASRRVITSSCINCHAHHRASLIYAGHKMAGCEKRAGPCRTKDVLRPNPSLSWLSPAERSSRGFQAACQDSPPSYFRIYFKSLRNS